QVVAVAHAGFEAGAIAGAQRLFAVVGHHHQLTVEDVDELVLCDVPVALARPRAGRQREQVHPELRQAGGVAELAPRALTTRLVERRRIPRAALLLGSGHVDLLGHARTVAQLRIPSKARHRAT